MDHRDTCRSANFERRRELCASNHVNSLISKGCLRTALSSSGTITVCLLGSSGSCCTAGGLTCRVEQGQDSKCVLMLNRADGRKGGLKRPK